MPKFTERFISSVDVLPGRKDRLVFDTETPGLGLRVTAAGSRVFLVQWSDRATGRKTREPLGAFGAITLEQARDAARIRLGRLAAGFDPRAEAEAKRREEAARREQAAREAEDRAFTVSALISDWETLHLSGRRASYRAWAPAAVRRAFAKHLDKPASKVTPQDVVKAVDAIASEGKATAAGAALRYGKACFGWAVKRHRLPFNPCAGIPMPTGSRNVRERVLNAEEIGAVWRAAGALPFPFGPAIRLLLLTAQRRAEVGDMRWSELSRDGETWTIPGERAKNGRAHVVHLSAPARAILASVPRVEGQDHIFSTTGRTPPSGWTKAGRALDRALAADATKRNAKPPADFVLHDFRRACVTWLAENGHPPHVADRILNHVTGSIAGVAAVYQRAQFLPERRVALDAWGAHVLACGEGRTAGEVASLDAARRRKRAPRSAA